MATDFKKWCLIPIWITIENESGSRSDLWIKRSGSDQSKQIRIHKSALPPNPDPLHRPLHRIRKHYTDYTGSESTTPPPPDPDPLHRSSGSTTPPSPDPVPPLRLQRIRIHYTASYRILIHYTASSGSGFTTPPPPDPDPLHRHHRIQIHYTASHRILIHYTVSTGSGSTTPPP